MSILQVPTEDIVTLARLVLDENDDACSSILQINWERSFIVVHFLDSECEDLAYTLDGPLSISNIFSFSISHEDGKLLVNTDNGDVSYNYDCTWDYKPCDALTQFRFGAALQENGDDSKIGARVEIYKIKLKHDDVISQSECKGCLNSKRVKKSHNKGKRLEILIDV